MHAIAHGRGLVLAAIVFAIALGACAPLPPPAPVTTRPAARPDTTTTVTPPVPAPVGAAIDSTPSADALAVLETIPEPLPPGERVAPPEDLAPPDTAGAPEETADTGAVDESGVPVPSPTRVLGEAAPPDTTAPDTSTTTGPAPKAPPAQPSPPPARPSEQRPEPKPAAPAGCWRLQVAAPKEKAEADRKRDAAQSQLLVAMVVERGGSLYKVRSRDCYERTAADRLRERANLSGFDGSFLFQDKAPK